MKWLNCLNNTFHAGTEIEQNLILTRFELSKIFLMFLLIKKYKIKLIFNIWLIASLFKKKCTTFRVVPSNEYKLEQNVS